MDTRLAILSAAAFAGVVVGGALIADPGLTDGLRGGNDTGTAQLADQGGSQPTDAVLTAASSTTGTRDQDEHDGGHPKDDARRASGEREHADGDDD